MARKKGGPLLSVAQIFNKVQEGISGHSKYAKLLWDAHEARPEACWRDFAFCIDHLLALPQARYPEFSASLPLTYIVSLKLKLVAKGDHANVLSYRAMPMWSERCVSWPASPHRGALGTQSLRISLWRCEETRSMYDPMLPELTCWCKNTFGPPVVKLTGDLGI